MSGIRNDKQGKAARKAVSDGASEHASARQERVVDARAPGAAKEACAAQKGKTISERQRIELQSQAQCPEKMIIKRELIIRLKRFLNGHGL